MHLPAYLAPQGPFTVEARFLLRSYPSTGYEISDIVNTATWDVTIPQGFSFRVGGGLLYPPLPDSDYATVAEVEAAATLHQQYGSQVSQCVGEMAMANGTRLWKETETDRCVELSRWTYMVSVWDGKNLKIYLNGEDATDTSRLIGIDYVPLMFDTTALTVGARDPSMVGGDFRHFDGLMDFARVVDTAMSIQEIRARYKTMTPDSQSVTCNDYVSPVSPVAGRCVFNGDQFKIHLVPAEGCDSVSLGDVLKKGDSVDVELSKDLTFDDSFCKLSIADSVFTVDPKLLPDSSEMAGAVYWRVRLRTKTSALAKTAAVDSEGWSLPAPILFDPSTEALSVKNPTAPDRLVFLDGGNRIFLPVSEWSSAPRLHDLTGKTLRTFAPCNGGWCLDTRGLPKGLFLAH